MRNFLLTLTTLCIALFAQAQDVNTMYIYRNNGNIEEIPVTDIDSITFTKPATSTPDIPTEPDQPTITAGEAIDLGLSVKWASCNVGATKPEEYGGYYTWGETEEKENYSWETYKHSTNSYFTQGYYKTKLDLKDDVAYVKWGGNWRMPTRAEQEELRAKCKWEWSSYKGVEGYKVTGPSGNYIFLPGAGCIDGMTNSHSFALSGCYWSSELSYYDKEPNLLYFFHNDDDYYINTYEGCHWGLTVRPVCE